MSPRSLIPLLALLIMAFAISSSPATMESLTVPPITRPHPRLLLDQEEIKAMKDRVEAGQVPHAQAWERLKQSLEQPMVIQPFTGPDGHEFFEAAIRQGGRARDLALAWHVSGQEKYAQEAVEILTAWAGARPLPGTGFASPDGTKNPDWGMLVARGTLPFLYAYDLLYDAPSMNEARRKAIEEWFRAEVPVIKACSKNWQENEYFGRQYYNNHLAAHAMGLQAIGTVLGDRDLVQYAISHPDNPRDFCELIEGLIFKEGDQPCVRDSVKAPPPETGEIYDRFRHHTKRGRGLQYSHLSMSILGIMAEIGAHSGLPLWTYAAPGGETLRQPFEYYSDFYRLEDAGIKSGYYAGETDRIGRAGDSPGIFELALNRFPDSEPLQDLLWVMDRPLYRYELIGPVLLTHGLVFPEQKGKTAHPVPSPPAAAKADPKIVIPPITNPHPRLLLDAGELEKIAQRAKSGEEPWGKAWAGLRHRAEQALTDGTLRKAYQGTDAFAFYRAIGPASAGARDLALAWWISGDSRFADAAKEILDAWAGAKPAPGTTFSADLKNRSQGMLIARGALGLIWAYDLLAGGKLLSEPEKAGFQGWLAQLVPVIKEGAKIWSDHDYFDRQYFQNHLVSDVMGLVAIGYALGDQALVQYAVNSEENDRDFLDLISGMILMPGDEPYYREPPGAPLPQAGEIIDRYRHFQMAGHAEDYVTHPERGLQYAILSTEQMYLIAEMIMQNGVDLYAYQAPGGETLELPAAFYADFYRLKDASIRGEFYRGETERIGKGGDKSGFFEMALRRYPGNESLRQLIASLDRGSQVTDLSGSTVLTHGIDLSPGASPQAR